MRLLLAALVAGCSSTAREPRIAPQVAGMVSSGACPTQGWPTERLFRTPALIVLRLERLEDETMLLGFDITETNGEPGAPFLIALDIDGDDIPETRLSGRARADGTYGLRGALLTCAGNLSKASAR